MIGSYRPWALAAASAGALAVGACQGDNQSPKTATPCNPLGELQCLTPWPSAFFEADDATTATGRRLALTGEVMPVNTLGDVVDPSMWNAADGFSAAAPMVMAFAKGVDVANLVGHEDMTLSTADTSPTLLIDLTAGVRVPHFAEVDAQAPTAAERALLLRPAQRLAPKHRYAVVLTRALRDESGAAIERSDAFATLIEGDQAVPNGMPPAYAARVREVIAAVVADGTPRDEILLTWDFTVASDEFIRRDALAARDRAVAALDTTPQTYELSDPLGVEEPIAMAADGWFDAPLFLTNGGAYDAASVMARDGDGLPAYQGMYRAPFTVLVPTCALTAPQPVGIIVYGHGLMGAATEGRGMYTRATAAALCMVVVATDLRGMSSRDIGAVGITLTSIGKGRAVFEGMVQGLVNHVALSHLARTVLATDLFVRDDDNNPETPPVPFVDPSKIYYYGLSQGHIFGTSVAAYDPIITRAVLGVGGGNYSMLLDRSTDWPTYREIMAGAYPDALDRTLIINLLQQLWDRSETAGVANDAIAGTAFGNQPKQFLLQMALGDDQVPNLGTEWQARTMGIPVLLPSPKTPWGLSTATDQVGAGASALAIYDNGAAPPPVTNVPAADTGAHYATRNQPAAWRQMAAFFATGVIANECAGACLCATDACQ